MLGSEPIPAKRWQFDEFDRGAKMPPDLDKEVRGLDYEVTMTREKFANRERDNGGGFDYVEHLKHHGELMQLWNKVHQRLNVLGYPITMQHLVPAFNSINLAIVQHDQAMDWVRKEEEQTGKRWDGHKLVQK
ncbi:MAG: hypothetical protein AAB421_04470 [Patescibacteria group bacterium]